PDPRGGRRGRWTGAYPERGQNDGTTERRRGVLQRRTRRTRGAHIPSLHYSVAASFLLHQPHRIPSLSPFDGRGAARPHHDQPAEGDDHPAVPHPPDERVDRETEDGLLGPVNHAAQNDVEILP